MSVESEERIATRAVIVVDGKVLLGKRGRGVGEGQFALVGGKPDGKETLRDAVIRETREEIGLTFKNVLLWKVAVDNESVPGQSWRIFYFMGDVEGELSLKKDEVAEILYVGRNELVRTDIAFNHREILEEFFGLR